jgi:hypothetical protein
MGVIITKIVCIFTNESVIAFTSVTFFVLPHNNEEEHDAGKRRHPKSI